ncbi:hypothetical protein L1987_43570 [Smallanthus sonchifolius]|uniref:Uncharacterized protein n=1 Tax=Smallanthus sonchifolius TaxID=185202 RepID=A0ACB9GN06_9ASTR|nr:hypothetical protein L1987_43570 [Smallanthus sonchifolius]
MFRSIMAHPLLVFNNQNEAWCHERLRTLRRRDEESHIQVCYDTLDTVGQRGRFLNLVTPPWRRVFENDRDSVRELMMEFLATFNFQQNNLDYWDEDDVSFWLGGTWHSTSIALFGIALGIYTKEEIYEPTFSASNHSFPDEEDKHHPNYGSARTTFWNEVGTGVRHEPCNIAYLFYRLFVNNTAAGVNTPMFGGGRIMQLYEYNDEPTHGTDGPSHGLLDLSLCASMGVVTYLPDDRARFQDSRRHVWDPEDPESVIMDLDIHHSPQHQHSPQYQHHRDTGTSSSHAMGFPSMMDLYESIQTASTYARRSFEICESTSGRVDNLSDRSELPPEIREHLFVLMFESRKSWRKLEQNPPFCGVSKSAMKRRAKRYERCLKCGNWSHDGKCSKNQTTSQHEYTELIRLGAIRLQTERTLRKDSYVYLKVKEEVRFLKMRFGLDNLTLNESSC